STMSLWEKLRYDFTYCTKSLPPGTRAKLQQNNELVRMMIINKQKNAFQELSLHLAKEDTSCILFAKGLKAGIKRVN
ncbi:3490_t:CDS:1, partial [Entrophospora sp. SA101]